MEFVMKEIYVEHVRAVGRYRRDLGDITDLVDSISQIGLIHPITVTEDGTLIAGQRRLEAFRKLGKKTIPARIVSDLEGAVERLKIERDENTARLPMTPAELVALGRALEALEKPKAQERITAGQFGSRRETGAVRGETAEIVAEGLGVSSSTYRRARHVVNAAQDPDASPEDRKLAEAALEEMNATGAITPAYEKVRKLRPAGAGAKPKPKHVEKATGQRRMIGKAVTTLSGIAHGLKQIEVLHPDVTNVEAAQWVDGLSEARQAITVLIKRLKERTNAQI